MRFFYSTLLVLGLLIAPASAGIKEQNRKAFRYGAPRVTSTRTAPAYNPSFRPHSVPGYVPVRMRNGQVKLIHHSRLIVVDRVVYVIHASG